MKFAVFFQTCMALFFVHLSPLAALALHNSRQTWSLQGQWQGSGVAYDTTKLKNTCEFINYKIAALNNELRIQSEYTCEKKKSLSLNYSLLIQENELFYNGRKVGSYNDTTLQVQITDHHQRFQFWGSLDTKSNELQIIEIHTYRPFTDYFYTREATLQKVNETPP